VRAALNAPVADGEVIEDVRLQSILPTISWLTSRGARVILIGHLSGSDTDSFVPIASYLRKHIDITFIAEYADGNAQSAVDSMQNGDVVLFENLRKYEGEKANDSTFGRMLADYADVYVNDAFPAAHRKHASIVGVPQYLPSRVGKRFQAEVANLSKALDPKRPFVFILGGAKFGTKIPLVEKFASIADQIFLGGAIANVYLQADGYTIGQSKRPETIPDLKKGLESQSLKLPVDVVCETPTGDSAVRNVDEVIDDDVIVDIGPRTVSLIEEAVADAKMIVWNGPLGWYEKGYTEATDDLANILTRSDSETILGGGDTGAVVLDDYGTDDFSFVSTAGGAMVQFLANETLPGIEALQ
jgi:phosphoglycerate kinase